MINHDLEEDAAYPHIFDAQCVNSEGIAYSIVVGYDQGDNVVWLGIILVRFGLLTFLSRFQSNDPF